MQNRPSTVIVCLASVLFIFSCGGGAGNSTLPPPPPPPGADFSLSAQAQLVSAQQGGVLQYQTIQASPLNSFKGNISLTFSGLPAGATVTPTGSSSIAIPSTFPQASFQIIVPQTTPVGTTTVTVTGSSGSLAHQVTFSLTVTQVAPFAIHVSPTGLSMTPASRTTVQISVTANAGTSPQLLASVSGPPNNSQITVADPQGFLTPTNPLSFSVLATALAQPLQNFPIQITASDNSNNTAMVIVPLTVTVPFSANVTPTRSTFLRTDQSVTGITYDPIRKLVFASVEILNEVQVISSIDGHKIASIPVNFPAGIDEAADGSAVYVVSPYFAGVTIIDPSSLEVVGHANVPESVSGSSFPVVFLQVLTLSNGKVALSPALDSLNGVQLPLYLWDPKTNGFVLFGPSNYTSQSLIISRSSDHSKLVGVGGIPGGFVYDANTDSTKGPTALISGVVAVRSDGSQTASATYQNSVPVLAFYDANFNTLGSLPFDAFSITGPNPQLFYSQDGKYLYVIPDQSIGVGIGPGGAVAVIDTQTYSLVGLIPAFSFGATLPFSGQWITTFALDGTNMLFGAGYNGVGFLDLSTPTALTEPLTGPFLVQPGLASLTSPTQTQLVGAEFSQGQSLNLFVGAPPSSPQSLQGSNITTQNSNFVNVTIPSGIAAGPANATLTRSDGFFEIMPDAVTFGPTILHVDADAGSPNGGDAIEIVGYGLDAAGTQVLIGGKTATISHTVGVISGQAFPTERMTVQTPAGLPGFADVTVSTPSGSTTLSHAFQYLNSVHVYPVSGALDAIAYDASRKRLYLSNQDHNRIEIFDLSSNSLLAPIPVGNAPTSLALTPDSQLLSVVNSTDGTTSIIDPTKMQVISTYPLLTSADQDKQGCGGVVAQISPAAPHRMLVSVNCNSLFAQGLAHLINLDNGNLSCTGVAGCNSNGTDLALGVGAPATASSQDGMRVFFTANDVGILDLKANTLTTGSGGSYADCATDAAGDVFAADFGTYDANVSRIAIMAFEPYADSGSQSFHNVIGEKLSPSGSLLFYPQDSGVDIFDVHTGRLVRHLILPDSIPLDTNGMVIDETGTKLFLISSTGITIAQLYQAPLSLATIAPSAGTTGTAVTLKGSGFVSGARVSFGKTEVSSTYLDSNTLQAIVPNLSQGPFRVTIQNPDGTQYFLDDAFTAN